MEIRPSTKALWAVAFYLFLARTPALGQVGISFSNQVVTTQAPASTGCVRPTAATSLLTTDNMVYLYFEATITTSDSLTSNWLAPDGTVVGNLTWNSNSGKFCFAAASLSIGNLVTSQLGPWQARVYDNGNLLFSVPFTVTSDFHQVVTTQAPASTGCVRPTAATSLLTTDNTVYLYFEAAITTSDSLTSDWLAPDGTVVGNLTWNSNSGAFCFVTLLGLSIGNLPTSQLGSWQARAYDNGNLLFSVPFTVTAPPNAGSATSLAITTSGTGSGTVSSSPAGASCGSGCLSFAAGTVVTLTATPNTGAMFAGWSGACSGMGNCTVTMSSSQAVTAAFNLTVDPTLVSIAVAPTSATIPLGTSFQLTATGTYGNGSTQNLTSSVNWSSSSPATAAVNASGLVTGVSAGSVTITASTDVFTGTAQLTVSQTSPTGPSIPASTMISPAGPTIQTGAVLQFNVVGTYSDGSSLVLTGTSAWSVNGTLGGNAFIGSISATGLYTAPQNVPGSGSVIVQAASAGVVAVATVAVVASGGVLTLSAPSGNPGDILTIGGAFNAAATIQVAFTTASGSQILAPTLSVASNSISTIVPYLLDFSVSQASPTVVSVSAIEQSGTGSILLGPAAFSINPLPALTSSPGTVTLAFLGQLQTLLTTAQQNQIAVQTVSGVSTTATQADMASIATNLLLEQAVIEALVSGQATSIPMGTLYGQPLFLDLQSLAILDQLLTAYLSGGGSSAGPQLRTSLALRSRLTATAYLTQISCNIKPSVLFNTAKQANTLASEAILGSLLASVVLGTPASTIALLPVFAEVSAGVWLDGIFSSVAVAAAGELVCSALNGPLDPGFNADLLRQIGEYSIEVPFDAALSSFGESLGHAIPTETMLSAKSIFTEDMKFSQLEAAYSIIHTVVTAILPPTSGTYTGMFTASTTQTTSQTGFDGKPEICDYSGTLTGSGSVTFSLLAQPAFIFAGTEVWKLLSDSNTGYFPNCSGWHVSNSIGFSVMDTAGAISGSGTGFGGSSYGYSGSLAGNTIVGTYTNTDGTPSATFKGQLKMVLQ